MSDIGQAGLGSVADRIAQYGTGRGAAESDARDNHPSSPNVRTRMTFDNAVNEVFRDAEMLLLRKHLDYGPTNISQSPGGPLNGLRVRMWDKLARINHLVDSGATPENESLRDSFVDLMNYAAIAQLVLDGDWPQG